MMDPDFQIRGGGGHLDPEIRGAQSPKKFFLALRASFWSKNKGGGQATRAPPLNPPLSAVALVTVVCVVLALIATTLFTATTLSGGSGGPGPPPLLFEQNEAQRAEKSLFGDQSPPLLSGCG